MAEAEAGGRGGAEQQPVAELVVALALVRQRQHVQMPRSPPPPHQTKGAEARDLALMHQREQHHRRVGVVGVEQPEGGAKRKLGEARTCMHPS